MTTTDTQQRGEAPKLKDFDYCLFCDEPLDVEPKESGQKGTDPEVLQVLFTQDYGRRLRSIFDDRLARYEKIFPQLMARFVKTYETDVDERIRKFIGKGYDDYYAVDMADSLVAREMADCRPKSIEELTNHYQTVYEHFTFQRLEKFCNTGQVEPTGPKAHSGCLNQKFPLHGPQQRNNQIFGARSVTALEIMGALEDSPTFGWYSRDFRTHYDLLEDRVVMLKTTPPATGHSS